MDKELVGEWFKFADNDIDTVLVLKEMRPQHWEIICYHCEQAAEKYLKSFLVSKEQIPPKTHDLTNICNLCSEQDKDFTSANVEQAIKYALDVKDFSAIAKLREDV